MVYELVLLNKTKRVELTCPASYYDAASTVALITTSVPSADMLATCHFIYQEAKKVLRATIQRFLGEYAQVPDGLEGPAPRIEMDFAAIGILQYRHGLIAKILMQYQDLILSPDSVPQDHEDRRITGNVYVLENGTRDETIQAIQRFIITAAEALHYQKTCIDRARQISPSIPTQYPQIQVALRLSPENTKEYVLGTSAYICRLMKDLRGHEGIQTCLHLLTPPRLCEEAHVGESMFKQVQIAAYSSGRDRGSMSGIPRVIAGEEDFDERKKDVYERLWRDGEW